LAIFSEVVFNTLIALVSGEVIFTVACSGVAIAVAVLTPVGALKTRAWRGRNNHICNPGQAITAVELGWKSKLTLKQDS